MTELTGDRVQVQIGDGRLLAFKSDNLKPYPDVENSSPSHSKIKRPMSAPAARCANKEKDRTAAKGHLGLKNFNFFAKRSSKVGVLPLEEVHANDWPLGERVAGRHSAAAGRLEARQGTRAAPSR